MVTHFRFPCKYAYASAATNSPLSDAVMVMVIVNGQNKAKISNQNAMYFLR
jgi:hypothetical protein